MSDLTTLAAVKRAAIRARDKATVAINAEGLEPEVMAMIAPVIFYLGLLADEIEAEMRNPREPRGPPLAMIE